MTYIAYGRNSIIRCTSKKNILEKIGGALETNAYLAFNELLREELVSNIDGKYYTLNLDKRDAIDKIISQESEEGLDVTQPLKDGLIDYRYEFAIPSNWKYTNQRTYYYYTRINDTSCWIVQVKGKSVNKIPEKITLGSFNKYDSRISCIWRALQHIANKDRNGKCTRKQVENIEPNACGNNRSPSGTAFRLFHRLGYIEVVEIRGNKEIWRLTGLQPKADNLDCFTFN